MIWKYLEYVFLPICGSLEIASPVDWPPLPCLFLVAIWISVWKIYLHHRNEAYHPCMHEKWSVWRLIQPSLSTPPVTFGSNRRNEKTPGMALDHFVSNSAHVRYFIIQPERERERESWKATALGKKDRYMNFWFLLKCSLFGKQAWLAIGKDQSLAFYTIYHIIVSNQSLVTSVLHISSHIYIHIYIYTISIELFITYACNIKPGVINPKRLFNYEEVPPS